MDAYIETIGHTLALGPDRPLNAYVLQARAEMPPGGGAQGLLQWASQQLCLWGVRVALEPGNPGHSLPVLSPGQVQAASCSISETQSDAVISLPSDGVRVESSSHVTRPHQAVMAAFSWRSRSPATAWPLSGQTVAIIRGVRGVLMLRGKFLLAVWQKPVTEKPSTTRRFGELRFSTPVGPEEFTLQALSPQQRGYRVFIHGQAQLSRFAGPVGLQRAGQGWVR